MRKISTLFVRDPEDRAHVLPTVSEGCEWVLAGEGTPTRKWDGTCVMLDASGQWWARREVKPGKTPPPRYVPVSTDDATGKTVGWEPVAQSAFAKLHTEAVAASDAAAPGTYELLGLGIQQVAELKGDREAAIAMRAADWVIRNFDDQIAGYSKSLNRMRQTLEALPEHERAAVEDASRELRKSRSSAAAFVPLDSLTGLDLS